jgi:hypothetical protein
MIGLSTANHWPLFSALAFSRRRDERRRNRIPSPANVLLVNALPVSDRDAFDRDHLR